MMREIRPPNGTRPCRLSDSGDWSGVVPIGDRRTLDGRPELKMFGGLWFLISGNMCVGIVGEDLMVRVGPEGWEAARGSIWVSTMPPPYLAAMMSRQPSGMCRPALPDLTSAEVRHHAITI